MQNREGGFTLVEMLIVIGLIALLASAVLVAVNPARQFKFARDTQRKAHMATILTAISQNMAEHNGRFICGTSTAVTLPSAETLVAKTASEPGAFDLASCIVPIYLSKMPIDPALPGAHFSSVSDYNSGYSLEEDSVGHVSVTAMSEMDPANKIILTR